MIYLHIGVPKTGTTTLQAFLGRNRDVLAKAGLQFPRSLLRGRAHHELARALAPARMRRSTDEARSEAAAELRHARELVATGDDLIFSSEMFRQAAPDLVAEVFPPSRTRIIVYIREQLDYLISAYAQRVQSTLERTRFVRFAGRFDPDYSQLLGAWESAFGRDNLDVGIYDRTRLLDSDIRKDFLNRLGLDSTPFDFEPGKREKGNPTIGPELIEFKGVLNALMPQAEQRDLLIFDHLAAIAPRFSRLRTSERFAALFRRQFNASNNAVRKRYPGSPMFTRHGKVEAASAIDRDEAIDLSMAALTETAPKVAARIATCLDQDVIAKLFPLLPRDWRVAERELADIVEDSP